MGETKRAVWRATPHTAEVRSLVLGTLLFRWVWLAWMVGLAVQSRSDLARPVVAWMALGLALAWTVWLTVVRPGWTWPTRIADLCVCGTLVVVSGLVVAPGGVVSRRPFFATGYPLSAPLTWGATGGPWLGIAAGGVLGVLHLMTRPINGVALATLSLPQVQNVTGAMLNYLVAGAAVGYVWLLLRRSAEAIERATGELLQERERAARLAERETLARAIHDSVLQSLALVNKRGRELAAREDVSPAEVAALAELAGQQEGRLRALILRPPDEAPSGTAPLRHALEEVARDLTGIRAEVSTVGPLWLPARCVTEMAAAVRQALENAARHSGSPTANVFAEVDGRNLVVTVRDQGGGFVYDEAELEARGKFGILKSMKGRIQDLGGVMRVTSALGSGTEIEFRVPVEDGGG